MRYLFALLLLVCFCTTANAADYYVCNTPENTGSDSNDGSLANPWLTFTKMHTEWSNMPAGSTMHMCNGGEWTVTADPGLFVNSACNSDINRCTLTNYVASGTAAGDVDVIPFIQANNSGTLFYVHTSGAAYTTIENIHMKSSTSSVAVWVLQYTTNVILDNLTIDGFANCVVISEDQGNEGFQLRNSTLLNSVNCIFGGTNDMVIDNNYFQYHGVGGGGHAIYLAGGHNDGGVSNVRVTNNTILDTDSDGAAGGGACGTVIVVAHGIVNDVYMAYNHIEQTSNAAASQSTCWAIAFDPAYPPPRSSEHFDNWVVEHNTIIGAGGPAISCASCKNTTIRYNTVVQGTPSLQNFGFMINYGSKPDEVGFPSSDVVVEGNVFILTDAENAPNRLSGITVDVPNATVKNNTMIFGETPEDCIYYGAGAVLTNNHCWVGSTLIPSTDNTQAP